MTNEDWRLQHLHTQPYLLGVEFTRKLYKAFSPDWDHDHCGACWAKFAEAASDDGKILCEGFATTDRYSKGAGYDWICPTCFADFREVMDWTEV